MRDKFRIEIRTEKSGRKLYQAQVANIFFWLGYKVVGNDGYLYYHLRNILFFNIEDAEKAFEKRQQILLENDNKKIIKIEYKYL